MCCPAAKFQFNIVKFQRRRVPFGPRAVRAARERGIHGSFSFSFFFLFFFRFIARTLLIAFLSRRRAPRRFPRNALFFRQTRQFPIHVTCLNCNCDVYLSRMPSGLLRGGRRALQRLNALVCACARMRVARKSRGFRFFAYTPRGRKCNTHSIV